MVSNIPVIHSSILFQQINKLPCLYDEQLSLRLSYSLAQKIAATLNNLITQPNLLFRLVELKTSMVRIDVVITGTLMTSQRVVT